MAEYMNTERPPFIPVRPGGEPKQVLVRLVAMDGTESFMAGRSVRYASTTHVMIAVGNPTEYFWFSTSDVQTLEVA